MSQQTATKKKSPAAAPTATDLSTQLQQVRDTLAEATKANDAARRGAPFVRKGESALTSRGYSYAKLFQLIAKHIEPSEARVEVDMHNDLQKFWHDQCGASKSEANSILAPFASELLPRTSDAQIKFADDVRARVKAGVAGMDMGEVRAIAAKLNKTLSWTDETALGALVAPPQFGELIEVLRNNEVFLAAGARTIGMPPNGRIVYPRQTGASTAYYIGESQTITDSEPTTGDLILQAKKVASLVKVPNELFRYSSISVEAFLRQDMIKVLALKMDKELLEGVGSGNSPKGLINYAGINTHTSIGSPADGNSGYPLQPEDIYQIVAKVEEANAVFRGWVMRPLMYTWVVNRRADSVTAGDSKGPFMFNVWREMNQNFGVDRDSVGSLAGYPVHKSTQLSKTRTRGSGTTNNTYIIGGDFNDYVVAMSPTIEFALTQQTTDAFTQDQTWLRAILAHDGGPRHEASFVFTDNLLFS